MLLRFGFDQCCEVVAGRQQLSPSLAWHRLFSQKQRLTFCDNRSDIDVRLRNVLWVISGHVQCKRSCPLYTQKRTFAAHKPMSALCQ